MGEPERHGGAVTIEVHRGSEADDLAVVGLFARSAGREPLARLAERWRSFARRPSVAGNVLLARRGAELVGVAWSCPESSCGRPSRTLRILVRKEARRAGIGSRLLAALVAHGREAGWLTCELPAGANGGRAFLEQHGFQGGPSLLRMQRALDDSPALELPVGYTSRHAQDESDWRAWCELRAECMTGALHLPRHELADACALASEPGFGLVLLERWGGGVAGYCHTSTCEGGPASGLLVELGVRASERRRGLARYLVARCLERFAESGLERCELFVELGSLPARRLYESLGFVEQARHECWVRPIPRQEAARSQPDLLVSRSSPGV